MFVLGIKYMPLLPTEGRIPEPSKAVEAPVSESARRAGG